MVISQGVKKKKKSLFNALRLIALTPKCSAVSVDLIVGYRSSFLLFNLKSGKAYIYLNLS